MMSQFGGFLASQASLNIGWEAVHYYGAATLLLAAMLCVVVCHNQRFEPKSPYTNIDWLGVTLYITALMSLAYIYTFGKQQDWFQSQNTMYFVQSTSIVLAVVIMIGSVLWLITRQLNIKHPFLKFQIYKIHRCVTHCSFWFFRVCSWA